MSPPISPAQVRGARGMLDWSMVALARAAGVSVSTVKRMETNERATSEGARTLVRHALEQAGIDFDVGGEGLRIVRPGGDPRGAGSLRLG